MPRNHNQDAGYETFNPLLEDLLDRHHKEALEDSARHHRDQMAAISQLNERLDIIMSKMDDFKVAQTAYISKVNAFIDAANANQQTSDQLVAAAVAAEKAGEEVDIQGLSDQLAAAAAKVPDAPTPPPPVPTI